MCTFRIFSESGVLAHWTSLPYGIAQIVLLLYIMSLHLYRFLLHICSLCLCISVGICLSPSLQSPPHRNHDHMLHRTGLWTEAQVLYLCQQPSSMKHMIMTGTYRLETFGNCIFPDLTTHQDYYRHPQQPHRNPRSDHRDHLDVQRESRDHQADPKGDPRADPRRLMASSNDMCMEHAQVAQIQRSPQGRDEQQSMDSCFSSSLERSTV